MKKQKLEVEEGPDFIEIFTDGSCLGNPGPGGWACAVRTCHFIDKETIRRDKHILFSSMSNGTTTNNKMELSAAIYGIHFSKAKHGIDVPVKVYTDSKYVQNGIESWIKKWKTNGWMNAKKKPVENQSLWKDLDDICNGMTLEWFWVKGHSNNDMNNLVDEEARRMARSEKAKM
jgi:ribonuclease HI